MASSAVSTQTNEAGVLFQHHSNLANAVFDLPAVALKLWLHLAYLAQQEKGYDPDTITVQLRQYFRQIGAPYLKQKEIGSLFERLQKTVMRIRKINSDEIESINLIYYVRYTADQAEFSIPKQLRPYLQELQDKSIRVLLNYVTSLRRVYSIRIYWLLCDKEGQEITIPWRDFIYSMTGKEESSYNDAFVAQPRILAPARKEIIGNKALGFHFDYKINKAAQKAKPDSITFYNIKRVHQQQELFPDVDDKKARADLIMQFQNLGLVLHSKADRHLSGMSVMQLRQALEGLRIILEQKRPWIKTQNDKFNIGGMIWNALKNGDAIRAYAQAELVRQQVDSDSKKKSEQESARLLVESLWDINDWLSVAGNLPLKHPLRAKLEEENRLVQKGHAKASLQGAAREYLRGIRSDIAKLTELAACLLPNASETEQD